MAHGPQRSDVRIKLSESATEQGACETGAPVDLGITVTLYGRPCADEFTLNEAAPAAGRRPVETGAWSTEH